MSQHPLKQRLRPMNVTITVPDIQEVSLFYFNISSFYITSVNFYEPIYFEHSRFHILNFYILTAF